MKRRFQIITVPAFLMLALIVLVVLWLSPSTRARKRAEKIRRTMQAQGFKLQVSEFDLASSPAQRAQAILLVEAGRACRGLVPGRELDIARPVATNAAEVLHTKEKWRTEFIADVWPTLEQTLARHRTALDAACAALQSGPIRFEPVTSPAGDLTVPYLEIRDLAAALAARTVFELHAAKHGMAFSNLLGLTRLATEWEVEPVEAAHYMRFFLLAAAERTLWEALQSRDWDDGELRALQEEWQKPQFFRDLPQAIAMTRASLLRACEYERQQPVRMPMPMMQVASEFLNSPGQAWGDMNSGLNDSRYRHHGIYEDELEVLLYFRDRELETSNAIMARAWSEMRSLPGVTNVARFHGVPRSAITTRLNARPNGLGLYRQGYGLFRRAAEAEAIRRLAITALALDRYRLRHGFYPKALADLVTDFLPAVPIDFMDGKPLRYRADGTNRFTLYSIGLDCIDDGGQMMRVEAQIPGSSRSFGRREGPDLVWPRPATAEEILADEPKGIPQPGRFNASPYTKPL